MIAPVCKHKMLPTNSKSLDYVKFEVGNGKYLTHRTTIMKFPDSLLADLISKSKDHRETPDDHIKIDHDGQHFGTILNLMRTCDTLYARSLRPDQHRKLLAELNHYGLFDLAKLIKEEFLNHKDRRDTSSFVVVLSHHEEFIARLQRPVLFISLDTFERLRKETLHLDSFFNWSLYDVCLVPKTGESYYFSSTEYRRHKMTLLTPTKKIENLAMGCSLSLFFDFMLSVEMRINSREDNEIEN